jgi:hypothetical protein
MAQPLMPHATASWLVDNTALSFPQIADFCGLHILEIQAIADDMAATKLTGRDPVRAGELSMAEIEKGQKDPNYRLVMQKGPDQQRRTKGPRYTPVSKRQDKPDGIAWIIRNHPEVSDGQISKAAGIEAVQDTRLEGDREELIAQLRAERDAAAKTAELSHADEEAALFGGPAFQDPFKK